MLNLIGAVSAVATIVINLVAVTHALSGSLTRRLTIAGITGGWAGLAIGLGAAGRFAFSPQHPVPLIGVFFAVPLLTVGALALTNGKVRAALLGIPLQLLIGLNVMRILGVLFLLDVAAGSLSGPFPFSAGLGDIITGAFAIPLALRVVRLQELPTRAIARWNVFGTLDLFAAVALGMTSAAGSPLQLIHAGVGSQAMQYLPLCLVPTVLVPFYLITHAIIAAQLRVRWPTSGVAMDDPGCRQRVGLDQPQELRPGDVALPRPPRQPLSPETPGLTASTAWSPP
jgi:hypothetical protein